MLSRGLSQTMARELSDQAVKALKPRAKLYNFRDPQQPGHYVRVMPSGAKSFVAVARDADGKQKWTTIGSVDKFTIAASRKEAQRIRDAITNNRRQTFEVVANQWMDRVVGVKGYRNSDEYRQRLHRHLLPAWGPREFESIRRRDVAELQDAVEDKSGACESDKCLKLASAIFNWYEKRNEDYRSPIVRGMCRYSSKANARDRILTDAEIRALWGASGLYADMLKLLLLTAQTREKVVSIRHEDLKNGAWTIATEPREKPNAGVLDLPGAALDIIRRQPRSNGYVFPGARGGHYANMKARTNFHQGSWVVHDLRRTARSLMSSCWCSSLILPSVFSVTRSPGWKLSTIDTTTAPRKPKLWRSSPPSLGKSRESRVATLTFVAHTADIGRDTRFGIRGVSK